MRTLFDDQNDLAAIVYAPHENPDAVLRQLAMMASGHGYDVAGLLQSAAAAGEGKPKRTHFHLLGAAGHASRLPEGAPCSAVLDEAGRALDQALQRQPDLLLISRFGRLELEGGGLLAQVVLAARMNIPVLLAVPEALFRPWLAFTGGLCVRLPCSLEGAQSWWRTVSQQTALAAQPASVCAVLK